MSNLTDQGVSVESPSAPTSANQRHDESIMTNISTEVQLDTTLTERLANLRVVNGGAEVSDEHLEVERTPNNHIDSSSKIITPNKQVDAAIPAAEATIQASQTNEEDLTPTSSPSPEPSNIPDHSSTPREVETKNEHEEQLQSEPTTAATPTSNANFDISTDEVAIPRDAPSIKADGVKRKSEKSAELQRSILAGEVSDNSECSIDEDDDDDDEKANEDVNNKAASSDEEMFIEDQDEEEDVEEEEEFHELEEERNKSSSQESVHDKSNKQSSTKTSSVEVVPIDAPTDDKPASNPDNENLLSQKDNNGSQSKLSSSEISDETNKATHIINDFKGDQTNELEGQVNKDSDWADIMRSTVENKDDEPKSESKEDGQEPETEAKTSDAADGETTNQGGKTDDPEKKELDLDEDVKNPQYIPKKGVFYEHDDRSHDAEAPEPSTSNKKEDEIGDVKESSGAKKNQPQDKQSDNRRGNRRQRAETDRWNHDLFRDEKQKPKSKTELISAYGYDIRQERSSRNQTDNRNQRGINNNNSDRSQGVQEGQRSRPNRDSRTPRQGGLTNRSRERKPRNKPQNNRSRTDGSLGAPPKREVQTSSRPPIAKADLKDVRPESGDGQPSFSSGSQQQTVGFQSARRDGNHNGQTRDRHPRNDRNRRQNSKDRSSGNAVDDGKLPPINTVMPPITTWSNKIEDMVKEEANNKASARYHAQQNFDNSGVRGRTNDQWPTNSNKGLFQDRNSRNVDEARNQQHYNTRRYQDRDDQHRHTQFINRNHHNDRSNQHNSEWRRTNNSYNSHAKANEPIKTQTFENSRLSQNNANRALVRDARDIINERRMQNQQSYQAKIQPGSSQIDQQLHHQRHLQHQQHLQQLMQQQPHQHSQQMNQQHHHHQQQHQMQLHQQSQHSQAQQHARPQQTSTSQQQQQAGTNQTTQQQPAAQVGSQQINSRHPQQQQQQSHQHRPNATVNNIADNIQDASRIVPNASNAANEMINGRPIVKTDAYTGTSVAPHSQQPQTQLQHSQNHRSLGGPIAQQGPTPATSHLVPSHIGTQAQYYTPSGGNRDSAAAAVAMASAYHGYMPGGHSVLDTSRYHMTSQQMSDQGYMTSPGQVNDVAAASALHQPSIYADATAAGGTVASSAYLAQAGSNMSPSTNIPVTGAGPPPPLPPVSYLQHSQYAPSPYSNPYSQPQHNQAPPPQSSHAYPYWTYI